MACREQGAECVTDVSQVSAQALLYTLRSGCNITVHVVRKPNFWSCQTCLLSVFPTSMNATSAPN